jgi:hypothetical protein
MIPFHFTLRITSPYISSILATQTLQKFIAIVIVWNKFVGKIHMCVSQVTIELQVAHKKPVKVFGTALPLYVL